MRIGLRIDVDTFRGTKHGVPNLCNLLADHSIRATFYFCVGPDNMGRHLWRLARPAFFRKALRSRAPSLYGWDILLKGTFGPGPMIGRKLGDVVKSAHSAGHEIGFHAWDHHAWQSRIEKADSDRAVEMIRPGLEEIERITGERPLTSAAPAWKCTDAVLRAKSRFEFRYNSDCRGNRVFYPVVGGVKLDQPQVPVTLPTYDEAVGRNGVSGDNYNDHLLSLLSEGGLNVLTIHAEVEGNMCLEMFDDFIRRARSQGHELVPLCRILEETAGIGTAGMALRTIPGREGLVACQAQEGSGGS
jgi:undecaprenyl phosphate-alpha-L-ara4FN deformylase